MIHFDRYPHVKDLFIHYAGIQDRSEIITMLENGIHSENDAEILSKFAWKIAELVNQDEEKGVLVLGSTDNTEMIPDLSHEMTRYFRSVGYFQIWKNVSDEEMS